MPSKALHATTIAPHFRSGAAVFDDATSRQGHVDQLYCAHDWVPALKSSFLMVHDQAGKICGTFFIITICVCVCVCVYLSSIEQGAVGTGTGMGMGRAESRIVMNAATRCVECRERDGDLQNILVGGE